MGSSPDIIDTLHTYLKTELSDRQFELLCGALINDQDNPDETVVTKRTGDTGLDVWVRYLGELTQAVVAVEAKCHTNRISRPQLATFQGNLGHRADSLVFITTSDYSGPAKQYAEDVGMTLYNGREIAELLHSSDLDFSVIDGDVVPPEDFWPNTVTSLFPSKLVPQADNIATLCCTIEAIGLGKTSKLEILSHIREKPHGTEYIDSDHLTKQYTIDSDYKSRHPDFYGHAAILFGLATLKDEQKEYRGNKYQQWELTDRGEQLFTALQTNDDETAHDILITGIRNSQLTALLREQVDGNTITRNDITNTIQKYAGLNETTATRRAQTVENYLAELPELTIS